MSVSLPAIIIGGPPHSGKSVLSYSLTKALQEQGVDHYLLRACPDGEGNWSHEAPATTVQRIRRKDDFSDHFVRELCADLANRHLPLLVDVGGKLTVEQDAILHYGTHAVLLVSDQQLAVAAAWRQRFANHHLPLLADLESSLCGQSALWTTKPTVWGRQVGLERGATAQGELFAALVARVAETLRVPPALLRQRHQELAFPLPLLEVDRIDATAQPVVNKTAWQPAELASLLTTLPIKPYALYGRGPGWLYAALAHHLQPYAVYLFDARMGWVTAPPLTTKSTASGGAVNWHLQPQAEHQRLEVTIPHQYLAYEALATLHPPPLPPDQGIVISGKLPNWLVVALTLTYRSQPWVAVYQPMLAGHAVVVASRTPSHPVGALIPAPALERGQAGGEQ
jgi:CRISPR-associated protein Csx3